MKLVKAINSDKYAEDFGLTDGKSLYLYDCSIEAALEGVRFSPIPLKRVATSPVIRVSALWVEKDIKVSCKIADTQEKKIKGLQGTDSLDLGQGLFFPYVPYSEVFIHQGSVAYPLDLIFIKDDKVCQIQENTRVGSKDIWKCSSCTGLIEVNGGFCEKFNVKVGDRVALFSVCENDLIEVEEEKRLIEAGELEQYSSSYGGTPNLVHLISAIADSL